MTAAATPAITWRGGADRVSHAIAGRAPRTLCGLPATAESLAWPPLRRCLGCAALVERDGRVR